MPGIGAEEWLFFFFFPDDDDDDEDDEDDDDDDDDEEDRERSFYINQIKGDVGTTSSCKSSSSDNRKTVWSAWMKGERGRCHVPLAVSLAWAGEQEAKHG